MDEQRFDQLSRRFAAFRTRRQAIRAIAGAAVATVAGTKAIAVQGATAVPCTQHYSPCGGDADCCAGAVCEYGLCMPGCRINGAFISAGISPPENICGQCQPGISTTSLVPVNEGMSCWSGDPNAGVTTCQSGACTGQTPQSCPPPTPCHLEGEVDPVTGLCVNPPAPEGTLCGNGPMCHGGFYQPADTCDGAGFCIGGGSQTVSCAPYQCGNGACLTSCASNADCVGGTSCFQGECCVAQTCDQLGYGRFLSCGVVVECDDPAQFCPADADSLSSCPSNGACYCYETIEGDMACHLGGQGCTQYGACSSSADCPSGTYCSNDPSILCPVGYCMRVCDSTQWPMMLASMDDGDGPRSRSTD